ncbi:MAG TPA: histidine kinase [Telluria sp.]
MEQGRHHLSTVGSILAWLHRGFDAVATWVTQLSWWKFLLFATLSLIAATILQDELFSGPVEEIVVHDERSGRARPETQIMIDERGIHFSGKRPPGVVDPEPAQEMPEMPVPPVAPVPPKAGAAGDVHIPLPPQIGEELSIAIEQAVENAAEQKVTRYHKQASTWFRSFVLLLLIALFATKALVGGKKRAELQSREATEAAERESMHRQLSEAKMQMMQAQVEPHFLFNTLASVEHLIETDPPRASAMQRSLIQYLRAVLPQMRDNNVVTNLGREADMVRAYLNLLKMRMEERLTVSMEVPEYLRSAAFPPMMLQSLVENAIKHGLECKPEGGTLRIFADVVGDRLRVIVSDNGVGFGVVPSTGTGTGLTNIRERLKMLFGERATLRIGPNEPSGVVATIEVPYQPAK